MHLNFPLNIYIWADFFPVVSMVRLRITDKALERSVICLYFALLKAGSMLNAEVGPFG